MFVKIYFLDNNFKKRSRRLKFVVVFIIGFIFYIFNEVGMFAEIKMFKLNGSLRNVVVGGYKI